MVMYEHVSAVGVGQTYTTMTSWETGNRADLTAKVHTDDGYVEVAEIYGGGALATVSMSTGWTTDATHYIQIRAASGQAHEGYYNTNKACLISSNGPWGYWNIDRSYTKVGPGLSIQGTMSIYSTGGSLTVNGCILQCTIIWSPSYGAIVFLHGMVLSTLIMAIGIFCLIVTMKNGSYDGEELTIQRIVKSLMKNGLV